MLRDKSRELIHSGLVTIMVEGWRKVILGRTARLKVSRKGTDDDGDAPQVTDAQDQSFELLNQPLNQDARLKHK